MESVGQRIRVARKLKKWSGSTLAKKIGSSYVNISGWETGKTIPKLDTLQRLAEALGVNLEWLISGEGEMKKSDRNDRAVHDRELSDLQLRDLKELGEQKKRELGKRLLVMREAAFRTQARLAEELGVDPSLISRWESGERVPDEGIFKALVRILQVNVDWLLSGEGQMWRLDVPESKELKHVEGMREVPILGVVPGSDPFAPGLVPEGSILVPLEITKHPRAFALRVMGDSMSPKIEDGDMIFVEPLDGNTPRQGSIVIALLGEETTCKVFRRTALGQSELTPLNPTFDPVYPSENDSMLGVVVGSYRAFKPLI